MVISTFFMLNKDDRERFFQENFLLADVKLDVVFEIFVLIINNTDVDFQAWDLQWRSYTIGDKLSTTRHVGLIKKKKFAAVALDPGYKAFVVKVDILSVSSSDKVYLSKKAQIVYMKADKALFQVLNKYTNFANVFLPKLAADLLEYTGINNHTIDSVNDWQLPYNLIYSIGLVKLEILKGYIKNNLANDFIRPFKSFARASIFFDKKPNKS